MRIIPIQQRNDANAKPNFQANVRFSSDFAQHYAAEKLNEVTKLLCSFGSFEDSISFSLRNSCQIICAGIINNNKIDVIRALENSNHTALRNVLEILEQKFKLVYGKDYKNIGRAATENVNLETVQQETAPVVTQKHSLRFLKKLQRNQ